MYASILNITFDCADARAQAMFWAAVTGWTAEERDAAPGHVEYAVVPPGEDVPRLYFTTVPEPKTAAKNRVHLDLIPPGDDPGAELARLLRLGATVTVGQPPGVSWLILADPEGNEFCLERAGDAGRDLLGVPAEGER
jgi:predicted enzyme related to lactoylglutathione lyase